MRILNIFSIYKKAYSFILFLALFYLHTTVSAENILIFNVTGQPPLNTNKHDGFMDEVAREALRRVGYKLVIHRQPAERGLRSINKGVIDGEMSRIKGINKIYPNLIQVNEKIMNWDFVVFSKKEINLESGWTALENKNVSFINGWKILENNVPDSARITKTKNSEQLFNLLEKNRTDFVIYEFWGGHSVIENMNLKKNKNAIAGISIERDVYLFTQKTCCIGTKIICCTI